MTKDIDTGGPKSEQSEHGIPVQLCTLCRESYRALPRYPSSDGDATIRRNGETAGEQNLVVLERV